MGIVVIFSHKTNYPHLPITLEWVIPAVPAARSTAVLYSPNSSPSLVWLRIISEPSWLYQIPSKLLQLIPTLITDIIVNINILCLVVTLRLVQDSRVHTSGSPCIIWSWDIIHFCMTQMTYDLSC